MRRRPLLIAAGTLPFAARADDAPVQRGRALVFPRDHGAHPAARSEWWYATGWLQAEGARSVPSHGFQLTFFRSRGIAVPGHASRFAARQLVFAHAALTDLDAGRAVHDQRIARAGFGIAEASAADTDLRLRDWTFVRRNAPVGSRYAARLASDAAGFVLDLVLDTTQPVLLQGEAGFSRKGPDERQASHYYSQPQLTVRGTLAQRSAARPVQGRAWLDHEWSDELLHPQAVGWDWIGFNLDDGRALTAFRLRRADGSTLWSGGSLRMPDGATRSFADGDARFTPGRVWASGSTPARYPVEWVVDSPAGRHRVRALLDAQELDSTASTGAVYWEGLSELLDESGTRVGLGYLEMTGYAGRLRL